MPRTARASLGNWCYHVFNRGNARAEAFHKDEDYAAFVGLFEPACERLRMRILGYCLMPNQFHLVLRPYADGDLGRWMPLSPSGPRRQRTLGRAAGGTAAELEIRSQ